VLWKFKELTELMLLGKFTSTSQEVNRRRMENYPELNGVIKDLHIDH